jgi:glycosyltransferase involved in cell wall biosynthesis
MKSLLVDNGVEPSKIRVIDNGTDLNTFKPLDQSMCRQELGLPNQGTVLGLVGNLWGALDLRTVFSAMKLMSEQGRITMLAVVGDGPARADFESLSQELLGIDPPVRWFGAKSPEFANKVLNAADVVLAPFTISRNTVTGLAPLKIRDCAAAGLRCVASRVAGIDMLGSEDWVFLAEPEQPAAFAAAIIQALGTDASSAQSAARRFATEHFDWRLAAEDIVTMAFAKAG